MIILGISSDFHDSSAALLVDGEIVASVAEERLSYQKHDPSFPSLAIDACLERAGLKASDVDCVAYHEDPAVKFSRVMATNLARFPKGFRGFARSMREIILGQMWVKLDVVKKLGIDPKKVHYVPHHLSHAAYSFLTSGMKSSSILVLDAVGEWSSTTSFRAQSTDGGVTIEPVDVIPYPHSLGLLYSVFTAFLGFKVNDGECSTMALASFGQPRYEDQVRKIIHETADGGYELDLDFFDFSNPERVPIAKKFADLFGPARNPESGLPFASTPELSTGERANKQHQYYADVASSVQKVLEDTVLRLCHRLRKKNQDLNLCLAGGVALNCRMNGRLMIEGVFDRIYIPPDPGDGGGALGAALYVQSVLNPSPYRPRPFHPYLGLSYDEQAAVEAATSLSAGEIQSRRHLRSDLSPVRGFDVETLSDEGAVIARAVSELNRGRVVGWFQGGFESGPRALGNRSLIADPRHVDAVRRLSTSIKLRARFRPYACAIAEESAGDYFANVQNGVPQGMRWMTSAHSVRESARVHISQALHVDGTTRPQIVSRDENPRFHELLRSWGEASGSAALLNTSFNESGYPLVSSPVDALLMFMRTDVEVLVLNNTIITKRF